MKYRVRVEANCYVYKVKGYLGRSEDNQTTQIVVGDNELIMNFTTREEAEQCMVNYMVKNNFPDIVICVDQHVDESHKG